MNDLAENIAGLYLNDYKKKKNVIFWNGFDHKVPRTFSTMVHYVLCPHIFATFIAEDQGVTEKEGHLMLLKSNSWGNSHHDESDGFDSPPSSSSILEAEWKRLKAVSLATFSNVILN